MPTLHRSWHRKLCAYDSAAEYDKIHQLFLEYSFYALTSNLMDSISVEDPCSTRIGFSPLPTAVFSKIFSIQITLLIFFQMHIVNV